MAPETQAAIETVNLSKTFTRGKQQAVQAVHDLSLEVPEGRVFGFLGANGAGKTTTIKMICGLVRPTAGRVLVNGLDVQRHRSEVCRQIGVVLEGTRNVHWPLSAWENLLYFGHLKGVRGRALRQRAEQLLRELDLWERKDDLVRSFSRGMQQKVAIACALVHDPPIVLLDEPTLGLDVQASRTVKARVAMLARERGKTVILTTHQLDMAQEMCDRVAIMSRGRLLTNRPVHELLALFRQEYYQIRLEGRLDGQSRPAWIAEMSPREENGHTILDAAAADQEALHALLERMRELGLPLISVARADPDLEEVFVRLVESQELPATGQPTVDGSAR